MFKKIVRVYQELSNVITRSWVTFPLRWEKFTDTNDYVDTVFNNKS